MGATKRKITKDVFYAVKAATKEPSNRERVMKNFDISPTTYRAIKNQCRTYEDYLEVTAGWRKQPLDHDNIMAMSMKQKKSELRMKWANEIAAWVILAIIIAILVVGAAQICDWMTK